MRTMRYVQQRLKYDLHCTAYPLILTMMTLWLWVMVEDSVGSAEIPLTKVRVELSGKVQWEYRT